MDFLGRMIADWVTDRRGGIVVDEPG